MMSSSCFKPFTKLLRNFYEVFTKLLRSFFTEFFPMGFSKHSKNFFRGSVSTLIFYDVKSFTKSKISQGVFQALYFFYTCKKEIISPGPSIKATICDISQITLRILRFLKKKLRLL